MAFLQEMRRQSEPHHDACRERRSTAEYRRRTRPSRHDHRYFRGVAQSQFAGGRNPSDRTTPDVSHLAPESHVTSRRRLATPAHSGIRNLPSPTHHRRAIALAAQDPRLTGRDAWKDNPRRIVANVDARTSRRTPAPPLDRRISLHRKHAMTRATELDMELLESKKMVSGTYLRNAWYVAAWSDDLADGQLLARTILKEPIVLYRKSDGNVAALEDRCPHRFAPLHMGKIVEGDRVQCPYHGLEFDPTGACVLNPHGTKNIPPRARVRSCQ
jgi:nitrite reductase/ring-hydroxylating ferredoxin subunit